MASNSNSERTNVITLLCFKLERFTQPCFLPFMAAEPRAHRCVRPEDFHRENGSFSAFKKNGLWTIRPPNGPTDRRFDGSTD